MNLVMWGFVSNLLGGLPFISPIRLFLGHNPGSVTETSSLCLVGEARRSQLNIILAISLRKLGAVGFFQRPSGIYGRLLSRSSKQLELSLGK